MRVKQYVWASSPTDRRLRLFSLSARRKGLNPTVVRCASIDDKPQALAGAIANEADDTLVFCTDGFDILCSGDAEAFAARFARYDRPIVFGAERECFHHLETSRRYFDSRKETSQYRYLNSGLVAGRAGALRQMLREISSWDPSGMQHAFAQESAAGTINDQTYYGRYASLYPELVGLDTDAGLIWNLAGEYHAFETILANPDFAWENPATGKVPCFLHFTQVRKYYPTMLTAALLLGVPLDGRSAVIELVNQHLTMTVPNIDRHIAKMDPRVTRILTATPAYRLLLAKQDAVSLWKRLRMEAGRRWRSLLGRRTPR